MKRNLLLFIACIILTSSYSQEDENLHILVDKIIKENAILKERIVRMDEEYYKTEMDKIYTASSLAAALSTKWITLQSNVAISKGIGKVVQINSIGKDNALGLDFKETMVEMVDETLTKPLIEMEVDAKVQNSTKDRWKSIVDRVLNNDLVQSFVKSNPFTSVASSLINSAIGFTKHKVTTNAQISLKAEGDLPFRYRDYRNVWQNKYEIDASSVKSYDNSSLAISEDAIKNFTEKLEAYINLYDNMANTNFKFQIQLEEISRMHIDFKEVISTYDDKMLEYMKVDKWGEFHTKLHKLTAVDSKVSFPLYKETIDKTELKNVRELANQYSILSRKVNELTIKYYDIHLEYFTAYVKHLNSALSTTNDGKTKFDIGKISNTKDFLEIQIEACKKAKKDVLPI